MRRRPFETYTSPWIERKFAAGTYELVVAGTFRGRSACGVSLQQGEGSSWSDLERTTATETETRFRVPVGSAASRLRYRLELRTGGAGSGPTVAAVELRASK